MGQKVATSCKVDSVVKVAELGAGGLSDGGEGDFAILRVQESN